MDTVQMIDNNLAKLPQFLLLDVLNFTKYLLFKTEQELTVKENTPNWATLSLNSAMRGMEDEQSPYTLEDLKEKF
jgi:hypothetical protein